MRNLFSKQLIKCPRFLFTSKRASINDFPSKNSAAKAIAKGKLKKILKLPQFLFKNKTFLSKKQFVNVKTFENTIAIL